MGKAEQEHSVQATSGNEKVIFRGNVEAFNDVKKLMVEGHRSENIVEYIRKTYPNESIEELLNAAGEYFSGLSEADPKVIAGWCFDATRELYQRMIAVGDFTGALRAVKQLRDLAK